MRIACAKNDIAPSLGCNPQYPWDQPALDAAKENAGQNVATIKSLHMWIISFFTSNGEGNLGFDLYCHCSKLGANNKNKTKTQISTWTVDPMQSLLFKWQKSQAQTNFTQHAGLCAMVSFWPKTQMFILLLLFLLLFPVKLLFFLVILSIPAVVLLEKKLAKWMFPILFAVFSKPPVDGSIFSWNRPKMQKVL